MWQALPIIAVFLLLSTIVSWATAKLFEGEKWGIFIGVGVGLTVAALLPLIFWNKHPMSAFITLFLNALSCGVLIGAYFIGTKTPFSFWVALVSALASSAAFLLLALLMNIPVLKKSRFYRSLIFSLWITVLFALGGALWGMQGGERYAAFTLLSIETTFFAAGSLLRTTESKEELFAALALPSSLAVGVIAIVALCILGGDGDCDADCCDSASPADCLDCSPDYATKKNKTTLSEISDPLNLNELFPPNKNV